MTETLHHPIVNLAWWLCHAGGGPLGKKRPLDSLDLPRQSERAELKSVQADLARRLAPVRQKWRPIAASKSEAGRRVWPEVGGPVCEPRLLDSRHAKNELQAGSVSWSHVAPLSHVAPRVSWSRVTQSTLLLCLILRPHPRPPPGAALLRY